MNRYPFIDFQIHNIGIYWLCIHVIWNWSLNLIVEILQKICERKRFEFPRNFVEMFSDEPFDHSAALVQILACPVSSHYFNNSMGWCKKRNSSALAMELRFSCTNTSKWWFDRRHWTSMYECPSGPCVSTRQTQWIQEVRQGDILSGLLNLISTLLLGATNINKVGLR